MPDYTWKKIGSGAYNTVYVNAERTLVLKIQKTLEGDVVDLDNAERSVRLWNEVNPNIEPKAQVYGYKDSRGRDKVGWIAPYIPGEKASDEEIANKVMEIYARTGRILVDACSPKNFIKTEDGKIICVDIGLALKLEKEEEKNRSFTSLAAWRDTAPKFESYFVDQEKKFGYPETVAMIKALLVIQDKSPNLDVMTLHETDKDWVNRFAAAYQSPTTTRDNPWKTTAHKEALQAHTTAISTLRKQQEKKITLEGKKDFCDKRLAQYILSRGSMTYTGKFKPSIMTRIFRNKTLTAAKVAHAQALRKQIQQAKDEQEISSILESTGLRSDAHFFKAGFLAKSDLEKAVKACQSELLKMDKEKPHEQQEPEGQELLNMRPFEDL